MDPVTLAMIGVGVVIGLLIRSNYALRQEVHSLRQQVNALTQVMATIGREVHDVASGT